MGARTTLRHMVQAVDTGAALAAALSVSIACCAARAEFANPHGVAVIIGNRSYEHERVQEVAYAHRDTDAFRRYVLDVLGCNAGNV